MIALTCIAVLLMVLVQLLTIRSSNVFLFRQHVFQCAIKSIREASFENRYTLKELEDMFEKISYDNMKYSFKPLKVRYWFTDEQIQKFNLTDE